MAKREVTRKLTSTVTLPIFPPAEHMVAALELGVIGVGVIAGVPTGGIAGRLEFDHKDESKDLLDI